MSKGGTHYVQPKKAGKDPHDKSPGSKSHESLASRNPITGTEPFKGGEQTGKIKKVEETINRYGS